MRHDGLAEPTSFSADPSKWWPKGGFLLRAIMRRAARAPQTHHAWPFQSWARAFKDTLKLKQLPTFEEINPRDAATQLVMDGWVEVSDVILIPFKFYFSPFLIMLNWFFIVKVQGKVSRLWTDTPRVENHSHTHGLTSAGLKVQPLEGFLKPE